MFNIPFKYTKWKKMFSARSSKVMVDKIDHLRAMFYCYCC